MSSPAQVASPSRLNRRRLFVAACAGMFTFGMVIALLGALFGLPAMRERLGVNFAQQGDLLAILSIGLLLSSMVAGPLLDRFGSKAVLVAASSMVTGALLAFALARGFAPAAVAAALLGFGGSWLNIGTNALVSDIYPEERGRWLNLLGALFGVGALFVPLVVALAFEHLSVAGTMLVCAGVGAVSGGLCASLRFPPARPRSSSSFTEMLRAARYPGVLLFAVLLFFQSGNEASLSGWASTYIGSVGWSPRAANAVLLGYWVMAILGRSLSARAQAWLGKPRLVLASGLISVGGCLVLLAGAGSLPLLTLGAWMTALAFSAVFPTTLAMAGDRYPQGAGIVFGFLFSVSNFGAMLYPWAIGQVSQAAGVRLGMLVPLVGTLGVCACAAIVARRPKAE